MGFVALNATKAIFIAFWILTCMLDTNMVLALYPPAKPQSSGNWMTALKTIHYMWQTFKIINLFKEMILLNFALSLLVPASFCEHFVASISSFLFYLLLF
jgi:hypothetical protein